MTDEQKRERNRTYQAKWYKANKQTQIKRSREQKKRMAKYIWELKFAGKCDRCPEDHAACLDFHHIDPSTKLFCIGDWQARMGMNQLKAEVAKCILLCSNCHRKLHYNLRAGL